ncbi:testis-expressed protein 9 [Parambassis ranga]|uniref:Testis-expressed protein 9 n=1 Tax=Parambassis ranga TaxID=210632 RepID=A0A6P7HPZ4_9TELE|nr:testis-expressed protein 9 [Parambassis ranga]
MAERGVNKKAQAVVSQTKKRPASTSKAEKKKAGFSLQRKSASAASVQPTDELLAKEEQYKLLNAELEAKTADLVRQAEQLMREQSEALSKPLSNVLLIDSEDEGNSRPTVSQQQTVQDPGVKVVTKKHATSSQNMYAGKPHSKEATSKVSHVDDLAAVGDSADIFLAKTIRSMEERMNEAVTREHVMEDEPADYEGVSDAQVRVLKAKLRILQEELDQLSCDYLKKDDENSKLCSKIKELEEDRARLQKTSSVQQTQIEKHKALAEESAKKCDSLHIQVSSLNKEVENLNRSHKQAAAVHSTVEVRLNRALEEAERLKSQLSKMQQMNKDKISEEHHSKENLLAENKMLKKQKAELILGFKKQLKLIDVLKRQKMHLEAAKLLSFTEDEFMKALDWGQS